MVELLYAAKMIAVAAVIMAVISVLRVFWGSKKYSDFFDPVLCFKDIRIQRFTRICFILAYLLVWVHVIVSATDAVLFFFIGVAFSAIMQVWYWISGAVIWILYHVVTNIIIGIADWIWKK